MFNYLEKYVDFSTKINEYILTIMLEKKISYEEYRYSYVWEAMKAQGVAIRGFDFKKASECILGMFVQDQLEDTIVFNQNLDNKTRNFVISHEIIHYLFHKDVENSVFIDTKKSFQYFYHEELQEFQANIGASIILVPDGTLCHFLKQGWGVTQLANCFGIPEKVLSGRLIKTMQVHLGVSLETASECVNGAYYRFNKNNETNMFLLVAELESKLEKEGLIKIFKN